VKERSLIVLLALHAGRTVSASELIDALWDSEPPASAEASLRVLVARVRKVLSTVGAREVLRTRAPGYQLEVDEVDAHRFEQLAARGRAELAAGRADVAAGVLGEALGLWRGGRLAEIGTERLRAESARWEEARLGVMEARVEALLACGRHPELLGELELLCQRHPLRERLWAHRITALYRCGRQAEALAVYQQLRITLGEELGIDPSPPLRRLEAAVLTQDPDLDAPTLRPPVIVGASVDATAGSPRMASDAAPGSSGPRRHQVWNVPARNPRFTGRDGMLDELHRRLRSGEATLVVQALHGLGGVGKTQLALEYAHRFAVDYDLVWWIDAEQPVLISNQLARLAARLELPSGPTVPDTVDRLLIELRGRERWLLILDNAERPADVAHYRPGGPGHVLITSRFPGWGSLGGRLEVDVLARTETVNLLQDRIPVLDDMLADKLAAELGDLPLAAAQAAGYLEQTGLPPEDYLRRFLVRRADLLARGEVLGYHGRIDTTWALSVERLAAEDPAAVQLLQVAAFLAPEPIPLHLFSSEPGLLAEPLQNIAADRDALGDAVGALVGYSLARRHPRAFQIHRLVQAVIRLQLSPGQQRTIAEQAAALLAAAAPADGESPASWAAYAELAPHVLANAPRADHTPAARQLILDTAYYLYASGDEKGSRTVSEQFLNRWRAALGPDHPDTLSAATNLSLNLFTLGEAKQGRALGEDTLRRSRRVLGADNPATLRTAIALTFALSYVRDAELARAVGEDTVYRSRRVLGPDDPMTLWAAAALTRALADLGDAGPACALGEETLRRCRRVLGPDHLITVGAAAGLTCALADLGDVELARAIGEDTLSRSRRALGPDHRATLGMAAILTFALAQLGEAELAGALGKDTLYRSRRVLGPDHPTTLWAAVGLTRALSDLGDGEPARALGEDTLRRSRQLFGSDHLITLWAAGTKACALANLGDAEQARTQSEDTLHRSQRVLGPQHPITRYVVRAMGPNPPA
jgi:DNA-binding SARP family transcriptional activator